MQRPTSPSAKRILGLDPGLRVTGYAVLGPKLGGGIAIEEAGVLRSEPTDMPSRVKALYDGLVEVLDQWQPGVIAIEQLYAHAEHPRTAVLMAHARGCFLLAGAQRGIPVLSYPSTRVKKTITGHGRATKDQMQHAIMRELGLDKPPEPHDVADALAVALCHAYASSSIVHGSNNAVYTGVNMKQLLGTPDEYAEDDA